VEGSKIVDVSAVQFCARKIAAVSGDMRKALDICRRAVEVVETEAKRQQILKPIDLSKYFSEARFPQLKTHGHF
jgi:cell division control protein 6